MSRITVLALAGLALATLPAAANAASFNCDGNLNYTERVICDNPGLSRADDAMSSLYFSVVHNGNYRRGQAAQVEWLRERDSCGANLSCIWGAYHTRIQELETGSAY